MKKLISLFTVCALTVQICANEPEKLPPDAAVAAPSPTLPLADAPVAESQNTAVMADETEKAEADRSATVPASPVLANVPAAKPNQTSSPAIVKNSGRSMNRQNWVFAGVGIVLVAVGVLAVTVDNGKNSPGH